MTKLEFFTPSWMGTGKLRPNFKTSPSLDETTILYLWAGSALFVVFEIWFKQAADTGKWPHFVGAALTCCLAHALYLPVIKHDLTFGYLVTASLMTLGVLIAGIVFFGEALNAQKITAALLLVAASIVLAIPTSKTPT